jgi:hypothetical protein
MKITPACIFVIALSSVSFSQTQPTTRPSAKARLPEGNTGLARRYPGDKNLERDRNVVFVERFDEQTTADLFKRWDDIKAKPGISFSRDIAPGSADRQSMLVTHVGGQGTGSHLYRRLQPGLDHVFARFYVKFDVNCYPVHHFGTRLGGLNPAKRWPIGEAGKKPDGRKFFSVAVEPYGRNWQWDFYNYWRGMHKHGDGGYWGTPFIRDPAFTVTRGRWICVEIMVKMNDPIHAQSGEMAFWINGKLWRKDGQIVSHVGPGFPVGRWTGGWYTPDPKRGTPFPGLKFRDAKALNTNFLWAMLYITKAPAGHVSKVWYDNIVVAREYIGPITATRSATGGAKSRTLKFSPTAPD